MNEQVVYLNGQFLPISQASVSVLDRGFIFGDGIYDVIPVYQRKLFRPQQHLDRLTRSLAAVGIDNIYSHEQWLQIISNLLEKSEVADLLVYIQVTRGVAIRSHAFPLNTKPTVFIMVNAMSPPSKETRERGVACVTMQDLRWLRCDIKSTSLLGNVLAAQNAAQHSALETIQFRDGYLTEASASNVWIVKNHTLLGPKKNNLVLEGIRYGLFEELCEKHGIPMEMRAISQEEVFAADEVLLSSATKEVLPVILIDSKPVGLGKPGPMYAKLYAIYQEAKLQH
jgi:D-alanine transaminase